MAKQPLTLPRVIKMDHPEGTQTAVEMSIQHAQNLIDFQIKKKLKPGQCWNLTKGQDLIIDKDGKITPKSDK